MSESGDLQSSEGDNHHPQYYFSDGSAIFQVRVPVFLYNMQGGLIFTMPR
jgi:hypothetical protein